MIFLGLFHNSTVLQAPTMSIYFSFPLHHTSVAGTLMLLEQLDNLL